MQVTAAKTHRGRIEVQSLSPHSEVVLTAVSTVFNMSLAALEDPLWLTVMHMACLGSLAPGHHYKTSKVVRSLSGSLNYKIIHLRNPVCSPNHILSTKHTQSNITLLILKQQYATCYLLRNGRNFEWLRNCCSHFAVLPLNLVLNVIHSLVSL